MRCPCGPTQAIPNHIAVGCNKLKCSAGQRHVANSYAGGSKREKRRGLPAFRCPTSWFTRSFLMRCSNLLPRSLHHTKLARFLHGGVSTFVTCRAPAAFATAR